MLFELTDQIPRSDTTHVVLFELTDQIPSLIRHAHCKDIDQAAQKRRLQDVHMIV